MKCQGKKVKVGDRVRITTDSSAYFEQREPDWQVAIFLGVRWFKNEKRYRGSHCQKLLAQLEVGPQFLLPDGTKMWGIECWWEPLDRG